MLTEAERKALWNPSSGVKNAFQDIVLAVKTVLLEKMLGAWRNEFDLSSILSVLLNVSLVSYLFFLSVKFDHCSIHMNGLIV